MEYTVKFACDVISKRSLITRKNGEIDITTAATIEELQSEYNQKVIKDMIFVDVQPKVKQKIFNVEILKVRGK